jgi:hypothetical protein
MRLFGKWFGHLSGIDHYLVVISAKRDRVLATVESAKSITSKPNDCKVPHTISETISPESRASQPIVCTKKFQYNLPFNLPVHK